MKSTIHPTVAAVDLEPIIVKAMKEEGMTLAQAQAGAQELQRFYTLHVLFPDESVSPSKFMDAMWHLHILDTMKYPEDCDAMFGHFLHHFPYLGLRGEEDEQLLMTTFDRTKELYQQTFGEEMAGGTSMTVCGGGCALEDERPKPGGPKPKATLCGIKVASICAGACKGDKPPSKPGPGCAGACAGTLEVNAVDLHCVSPNGPGKPGPGCVSPNAGLARPTLADYLALHPNA